MSFDRRKLVTSLAALAGLTATSSASAAKDKDRDDRRRRDDDDYKDAARAREAGEIAPLADILAVVRAAHPGEVVGIELERKSNRWLYEVKLVTPERRYLEIYVDARDKTIVKVEGK